MERVNVSPIVYQRLTIIQHQTPLVMFVQVDVTATMMAAFPVHHILTDRYSTIPPNLSVLVNFHM
jgi:hypothetical protein